MKPKAIIFDLDWTLCNLSDSSNPYNHDWKEVLIPEMKEIFLAFNYRNKIARIILTGRKRKDYWSITEKWIEENLWSCDELIMQERSMGEKNHIFKHKKLIELKEKYEIIALFDDNPDLIPVCKDLWIILLHVNQ